MHVSFDPVTESIVRQIKSTIWRAKKQRKENWSNLFEKNENSKATFKFDNLKLSNFIFGNKKKLSLL